MRSPEYARWARHGTTGDGGGQAVHAGTDVGSRSRSHSPSRACQDQRPRNISVSFDESKAARRKKIIEQVWYRLTVHCGFLGVPWYHDRPVFPGVRR